MRFPDFEHNWESKKLKDLSNIQRGASPRPITAKKWYDNENKKVGWVRIGDVTSSSKYLTKTEDYFSEEGVKKSRFLPKGSLIMSICATIGKPIVTGMDTCIHDGFVGFSELKNINKEFLYYYLNILEPKFISLSQTGSQANLNSDLVRNAEIGVPSIQEQEKIVNFISAVDKKHNILNKNLETQLSFKRYLMQQIFTQKLRFNFTDDWNYMNFSEIFKSVSTKKYQIKSADILDKGDFEVIDQGQDEIAGYFNDKTKLCQELPIIIYGDHTTFVKFRDKPFIVGADGVKLLIPKFNANPKYLFYALEHFNIKPEGYKRHFSIIKKIKLPIPTLEEQNEISEIFTYIDIKLKYTKIQLQETEEFKKGLLQQMFIVRINWRCNFKLAKSPSFNKHLLILKNKIIFIIIE